MIKDGTWQNRADSQQYRYVIVSASKFQAPMASRDRMLMYLPKNIIIVSQEVPLFPLLLVLNDTNTSYKVDHFSVLVIEKVVPALVASVTVHPFQPKLMVWRTSVLVDHLTNNDIHDISHVILNTSRT